MEEEQMPAGENKKSKGGRPKKTHPYYNRKVIIYFSDEEHGLLDEFANMASYSLAISAASRLLLLTQLREWVKKGKRKINLYGKYE